MGELWPSLEMSAGALSQNSALIDVLDYMNLSPPFKKKIFQVFILLFFSLKVPKLYTNIIKMGFEKQIENNF